ncbi:hypothetical protein MHB48_15225 [Psychrobacillus sp. FSL H8-0483]|uniref:hypothetical protein n=1 Tax=Psychrobacillus sp. FSL H8-0483 TaxID=2921389 RepID=UPI00315B2E28
MAQINNYGYEKLREYILSNWKYLEIQTPTSEVLKRYSTSNGLVITGTSTSTELEYKLVITGDATFLSKTVGKSVLFNVATNGSPIATEVFNPFTFETVDDQLTIIHKLQVPQIV